MLGSILGAGISAVSSLFGGKSASDAQAKANAQNIKMQKAFAQKGIQWKVNDAKKAGIHPLYALGANTVSFSPSSVGSTALGEGIANAGQNIGRAVASGLTNDEKMSGIMAKLSIQRAELENQKLASEIALIRQPGTPPSPIVEGPVIDGQGNAIGNVDVGPVETVSRGDTRLHSEAGHRPDVSFLKTGDGGYAPVPSKEAAEALESSIFASGAHAIRNMLVPSISHDKSTAPPIRELPDWANDWEYRVSKQAWYPVWNSAKGDR